MKINSKSDDELDACFTEQIEGTVTCSKFNYDFGSSGSRNDSELTSVVSDMDLVCDQAWTVPFTISMYSIAVIIGNMIGTPISDRYGRRPAFIIAAVGTVVFGVPQAFAPNWWSLMAFSMVQHGFMQIGYLAVSVYVVEVLGPTKRHLALIVSLMFAVGYASMSLYSWLLPNWQWFTLCLTIVSVPFIPIAIWVPESPVFLFSRGEYSRADSVLKLISDRSGGTYVSMDESEMAKKCLDDGVEVDVEEETYATMFTSCYFIRTMLSMAYLFFAASIVYYGLAYKAADLPGSVYVNNFLNALVDAAAYVVTALTMEHVGRKLTIGSTFTFGAVACVACGALFYYGEGEDEYSALNQGSTCIKFNSIYIIQKSRSLSEFCRQILHFGRSRSHLCLRRRGLPHLSPLVRDGGEFVWR